MPVCRDSICQLGRRLPELLERISLAVSASAAGGAEGTGDDGRVTDMGLAVVDAFDASVSSDNLRAILLLELS